MRKKVTGVILAAGVAGAFSIAVPVMATAASHNTTGQAISIANSCKGHGTDKASCGNKKDKASCRGKSDKASCKSKSSCKGKGKGSSKDKNSCKGRSSCKSE